MPTPQTQDSSQSPSLTYDPEWLAITRVFHPYLLLELRQKSLPLSDHLVELVKAEMERIKAEGLVIPPLSPKPDMGPIEIGDVQKFVTTAPAHGEPGGSECE